MHAIAILYMKSVQKEQFNLNSKIIDIFLTYPIHLIYSLPYFLFLLNFYHISVKLILFFLKICGKISFKNMLEFELFCNFPNMTIRWYWYFLFNAWQGLVKPLHI